MENISLKLEKEFLKAIEGVMKKHNYMTKTEFIREAIREKMKKLEEKDLMGLRTSAGERKEPPSYI
ncbi:MAG TPA: ribbon-helix-helix domain-containing protein [Candidatus Nanoarchaeia archaeon]|nr:ribbon-helix-helix domain-containing protein [Candidatus Nanoarchaeia archaeon]